MLRKNVKDIAVVSIIVLLVLSVALVSMQSKKKQDVNMVVGIHIKGEVKKPGYYELDYGSRIKDAIDAAGGTTDEAEVNDVNLAAKLRDGEEIIIPAKITQAPASDTEQEVSDADSSVNINTAGISELCSLKGIGEATAESIIEYRKQNGAFSKIEELKNVSGIGTEKFEKIKDDISV